MMRLYYYITLSLLLFCRTCVPAVTVSVTTEIAHPGSNYTSPSNTTSNSTPSSISHSTANLTSNTTPNSTFDEINPDDETQKSSYLSRLWAMWHCVMDTYHEPTTEDVHFLLYTRRNYYKYEELFLVLSNSLHDQIHELGVNPMRQAKLIHRRFYREAAFVPLKNVSDFNSHYFNIATTTKFVVHGYTESAMDHRVQAIKKAYLARGDYNVILVDWRVLSKAPCYLTATKYTKFVGSMMARLIDQLQLGDANLASMHIVGFSLGAHIAGFAGSKVVHGNVFRITGLDPALPLYMSDDPNEKLDKTDANFVDVIHTNAGILGQLGPTGHIDFYPNGGRIQNGCDTSDVFCSHSRAAEYFLESIANATFRAANCSSYKDFAAGRCNESHVEVMGEYCAVSSGSYYLDTNKTSPFGLG